MSIKDDLQISEEWYDVHANEFFIIFNCQKKDEEAIFNDSDKLFRIFLDRVRSNKFGSEEKFAELLKHPVIEKFWNAPADGAHGGYVGFANSAALKKLMDDLKHQNEDGGAKYSKIEKKTLRKYFIDIEERFEVGFTIVPCL